MDLFSSGRIVLQSMWSPAVAVVVARGIPCDYPALQEGYRGWAGGLGIMRHVNGPKLDAAYAYLNWMNSGWAGAFIARGGYYSSVPSNARKFLSDNEWGYWYEGKPATATITNTTGQFRASAGATRIGGSFAQRINRIACWNSVMRENDHLVRRWNEFLSA